ncbi:MAG: hypothetical protein KC549_07345, partial [Myxococcales bacterium]|nr:hypothetical protein [Myxococcales bacterium]
YVYVGDIGDNAIVRQNLHLRRFPEPVVPREAEPPIIPLAGVEDFTLVYPDGPHNCETLLVDPENGDVYLVTKSADGVSPIFRAAAPLQAGADIRLERVAGLTFGRAPLGGNASTTGGDIAPDGSAIVVRTYSAAFLWRRAPGATIAEAFATEPCALPRPRDPQGEAIGFARDGRGLYTVSEGAGTPVYFWERR